MNRVDLTFDSQFDNIALLEHYPWVGKDYASSPIKVLVLGDSHYTVDGNGEFCEEEYETCKTDKNYTRNIINCSIDKGTWSFHRNLLKTFMEENDLDAEKFWSKVASYNFIQAPMKSIHELPSIPDYETAWKCLADVARILKPTFCLFVGLRNDTCISVLKEKDVDYQINYPETKINNSYPRTGEIRFKDGYKLPFIMIHHTAQYYSPELWKEYLKEQIPQVMDFLA